MLWNIVSFPKLSPNHQHKNENELKFSPICQDAINTQHFVDLTSVDQHHGLKMMASIEDGKLILITGKNRGLLREIWNRRPLHHRKSDYLSATIETPDKKFTQLWIDKNQNLKAIYKDVNTGNAYCCRINLMPKFTNQGQLAVDVHTSASSNTEMIADTLLVKLILKGEQEVNVKVDPQTLVGYVSMVIGRTWPHLCQSKNIFSTSSHVENGYSLLLQPLAKIQVDNGLFISIRNIWNSEQKQAHHLKNGLL